MCCLRPLHSTVTLNTAALHVYLPPCLAAPPFLPTGETAWRYPLESHLHELLLQSHHRTLDPAEADFFYVPVYAACFMEAVAGWADTPWWHVHRCARATRRPAAAATARHMLVGPAAVLHAVRRW